mmetsp:Transcript_28020/g.70419  ORF Transcript_28020/g.70419 Transcript_28020/m.70419 type:complete len:251 (-) Transcript_28020:158-910(-)
MRSERRGDVIKSPESALVESLGSITSPEHQLCRPRSISRCAALRSRNLRSALLMCCRVPSTSSKPARVMHITVTAPPAARAVCSTLQLASNARSPKKSPAVRRITSLDSSSSLSACLRTVHTTCPATTSPTFPATTLHVSTTTKNSSAASPCRTIVSPSWKVFSISASPSLVSCPLCSALSTSTARNTRRAACLEPTSSPSRIMMALNASRCSTHRLPSAVASTVADRGLSYISASSPKEGFFVSVGMSG